MVPFQNTRQSSYLVNGILLIPQMLSNKDDECQHMILLEPAEPSWSGWQIEPEV
jgi:hypothetical protein